jgi:hypothetical protein
MRPRFAAPGALGALVILAVVYLARAGVTPEGQPPFAELDGLDRLRSAFNAARDVDRAVILLSPSCPYCLRGASDIERVLARHGDRSFVAFVVWHPILPTDWGRPMTRVLRRLSDRRVRQYWDAEGLVARELQRSFGQRDPQPACCVHNGVWWDLMAVFPPAVDWKDAFPEPLLLEGTVADAAPAFESILAREAGTR